MSFIFSVFIVPALGSAPIGPDVSHFQSSIDWPVVAKTGAGFAITKASEGLTYTDPTFAASWAGIRASGIRVRGAYHFGHPKESAADQAKFFVATVGKLQPGDFLALDIETNDTFVSASQVAEWSKEFVDAVVALTHLPRARVLLYTGAWFWDPYAGGSSMLSEHPLWISGYVPRAPPMPRGWDQWTFWQYTDTAKMSGIASAVDLSVFKGTQAELEEQMGHASVS